MLCASTTPPTQDNQGAAILLKSSPLLCLYLCLSPALPPVALDLMAEHRQKLARSFPKEKTVAFPWAGALGEQLGLLRAEAPWCQGWLAAQTHPQHIPG